MNHEKAREDNKRIELLRKLSNITFAAFLTILTSEGCLELLTFTSEGTKYQWIGYDDWNVFRLKLCCKEKISEIKFKIIAGSLSIADLVETEFIDLIEATVGRNAALSYSEAFSDLVKYSDEQLLDELYCYYDKCNTNFTFSVTQSDLKKVLAEAYLADTVWSDMGTDELESCLEKYHEEGLELPCVHFDNEEE